MFYIEGFPGDESDMICPQHAHPFFVFAWDIEDTSFHSGFRHIRRLWTDIIYDHDNPVFFFLSRLRVPPLFSRPGPPYLAAALATGLGIAGRTGYCGGKQDIMALLGRVFFLLSLPYR
jgi:hypothetical protein